MANSGPNVSIWPRPAPERNVWTPCAQIAESARLRHDDHAEDRQSHCGDDETDHCPRVCDCRESPEIGGKDRLPAPKNIEKNVMPTMSVGVCRVAYANEDSVCPCLLLCAVCAVCVLSYCACLCDRFCARCQGKRACAVCSVLCVALERHRWRRHMNVNTHVCGPTLDLASSSTGLMPVLRRELGPLRWRPHGIHTDGEHGGVVWGACQAHAHTVRARWIAGADGGSRRYAPAQVCARLHVQRHHLCGWRQHIPFDAPSACGRCG